MNYIKKRTKHEIRYKIDFLQSKQQIYKEEKEKTLTSCAVAVASARVVSL